MGIIVSDVSCDDRPYIDVEAVIKWLKTVQETPKVAQEIRFKVDNSLCREQLVFSLAQSGYKVWVEEVKRKDDYGMETAGFDVLVEQ